MFIYILKKIFIIIILSIISFDLSIIVVRGDTTSKIVFETTDDYQKLSLDAESVNAQAIDEIVIQIKFKTEEELEEINENIERNDDRYRTRAKQYFYNGNEDKLKDILISNYKSFYISKYSPYVEFTYEKAKFYQYQDFILNQLNSNPDIETVYVKEYCYEKQEQLILSLACAGTAGIYENRTYTGEGVTVGILEPGLVDLSHEEFDNTTCLIHSQTGFTQTIENHTTQMAAIIAAEDGIAPDATILSSYLYGSLSEEIEWMLDNDVDIINMSFGEANPDGVYASDSAYVDYIARVYGVIMVASTGNDGRFVANPGLGYNVVGVGSANEYIIRHGFSSYLEAIGPKKPTVVVHGSSVAVPLNNIYSTGTSLSAAITSGIIALMMDKHPGLKGYPEKVLALLTSSAQYSSENNLLCNMNGFDEGVGAGMISWVNFEEHYSNAKSIIHVTGTNGSCIYRLPIQLEILEKIKVSIAWTAYTTGTVDSLKLTNYDLRITDTNGNNLAFASSTNSNIEMILFEAPYDGTFYIKIFQVGSVQKLNEEIVLSYGPALDNVDVYS